MSSLLEFCILFIPAKPAFSNRDGEDGGQPENTASHLLIYHLFFSVYPFLSPLSPSSLLNPLLCFASGHWTVPRRQPMTGVPGSRLPITDHRLPITALSPTLRYPVTPILFLPPPPLFPYRKIFPLYDARRMSRRWSTGPVSQPGSKA